MPGSPLSLIEFPADDPARARRFWAELLGVELEARQDGEGEGWQTHSGAPAVGVHARGRGPGDSVSLPYFAVSDVAEALERVEALGGSVVHPGEAWRSARTPREAPSDWRRSLSERRSEPTSAPTRLLLAQMQERRRSRGRAGGRLDLVRTRHLATA